MNKEYIYNGGNVTVIDENGSARPVEYSNNLEEILIQENLIEEMEKRIKKLGNVNVNNKRYIPNFVPAIFLAMVIAKMVIPSIGLDEVINTVFGTMNLSTIATLGVGIWMLPLAIFLDTVVYYQEKQKRKENRAKSAEYEYLQKELKIQKDKLDELNKNKTIINREDGFRVEKVNDSDALNELKGCLTLYSDLGYNTEKYYKLLKKGKLDKALVKKGYADLACECAKEYIEGKGRVLTKKLI